MSLVKDPSKIIWVMLGSLRVGFGSVQVLAHSLLSGLDSVRSVLVKTSENLGSGSVRSCWVRVLFHL